MKIIYRCFSDLEVLHFNFIFSQDKNVAYQFPKPNYSPNTYNYEDIPAIQLFQACVT